MANFTITATQYVTDLVGKTGGDNYNIDGGTLIFDCDTRYAPNATSTTGPFSTVTVSANLGGHHQVTTQYTKLVPFDTGVGTVPAYGTAITQGAAAGVLLCVMQTRVGGTVYAAGATMPTSGWLKLRVTSPGFTPGLLSGITATATAAEEQGWIELVGQEAGTLSYARLGTMQFRGDWFDVGTINSNSQPTLQLPFFTNDVGIWYPGVDVETAPGSGEYQFWPNAGTRMNATNCSIDTRSMFCTISTTGLLTFAKAWDTSAVCGYSPTAGCKVRIPSIILQNCTSAARSQNVEPSRTMGTRMESNFTNAGPADLRIVTGAWYWNIIQPYSIYLRDLHVCDNIILGECATAMDIDNLHQGLSSSTTDFNSNGIVIQQSYNGGNIGTMSWLRATQASTSSYPAILVNLYGGWYINKLRGGSIGQASALAGALYWNTCGPVVINELWTFAKRFIIQAADNLQLLKYVYADSNVGTTGTTSQSRAVETVGQAVIVTIENIQNWPGVANCHPYLGLLFCNTSQKVTLRNCGTAAAPFNAGSVNLMAYIFDDGGNNDQITLQRNWTTALRLGLHGGTNTTRRLISVNNYQTDASKTIGPQQLDSFVHGNRFNSGGVPSSYASVYGNSMWDGFTGDTTTRAALILVEKSIANPDAYTITSGFPRFTGAGRLAMLLAGDQIYWSWPWKILGWTGLTTFSRQGQNVGNFTYEYDLDKGTGYSGTWKTCSNANLVAETGIDPVVGFSLRIRITCTVSNSANRIDSFNINGTTTLALQNEALYPLPVAGFKIIGMSPGSDIVIYDDNIPSDGLGSNVLATGDGVSNEWTFEYTGFPTITVGVFKPGYVPEYFRGIAMVGGNTTYKVQQRLDRNYSN